MSTYFVGPGGNNANSGLSYVLRKLTLNGAEDIPVVAGDLVIVAPGTYRESLTIDVSGSIGNVIEYRADVTGANTDGVGGVVRVTGSDNDQTATRASVIAATSKNYRTFTGFSFDTTSGVLILPDTSTDWIIQDCLFSSSGSTGIQVTGASQARFTIRRCGFFWLNANGVFFSHTVTVSDAAHLVENCIFSVGTGGVTATRVGGVVVNNCTMLACGFGVRISSALAVGQLVTVKNSIVASCGTTGLSATTTAEFSEDYNCLFANVTARSNVTTGTNSVAYSPLLSMPILLAGYRMPWQFGALSNYSQVSGKAGTTEATEDIFSLARPATSAKKSWGAVQFDPIIRETTTRQAGSVSLKLPDAGRHQIFVPVTNASTTISIYVYREANYAGTNPQMVIHQAGQADVTVTDAGSAAGWNQITSTFTPAATSSYVIVEMISGNTAVAGSYAAYFDTMLVTTALQTGDFERWITDRIYFGNYAGTPGGSSTIVGSGTPFKGPFG